jgi:hypothetical protein
VIDGAVVDEITALCSFEPRQQSAKSRSKLFQPIANLMGPAIE